MISKITLASSLLTASVSAQGVGTQKAETHPTMTWQQCTSPSSCTTQNGEVVIGMSLEYRTQLNTQTQFSQLPRCQLAMGPRQERLHQLLYRQHLELDHLSRQRELCRQLRA